MKTLTAQRKEIIKGAPAPELVDLWLARAFNAQDVEAAAAMYHPDASVVRLEQVHGRRAAPTISAPRWRATSD
jgi:ketosteroid isomerase-like protein